MHSEFSIPPRACIPRNGVLVLTGYGLRVAVERGHLIVSDGRGRERREGHFSRASRQLRRLVVIGHTVTISFNALRWLRDVGCAFVQIDADGAVIMASGATGLDDARLRRTQALAMSNGVGLIVARDLLLRKLAGQAAILDRLDTPSAANAANDIRRRLDSLSSAGAADRLRLVEADAAVSYWGAWAGIPVRWAKRDVERVPEHWRVVGVRSSPLTGSPRLATDPVNALLNYTYATLEAEARIALLAVGLDPGMGVLHADQRARDSLALDLMEAVRPEVDAWVLDVLTTRAFGKADFHETRAGVCRLMPSMAKLISETAPRWAAAVAPIAEAVARTLATEPTSGGTTIRPKPTTPPLPTPLTQTNRSAGRDGLRRGVRQKRMPDATLPAACLMCGVVLDRADRDYCDDCLPEYRVEQVAQTFARAGTVALAKRRAVGIDPAHGGDAGWKRGRRNAEHIAAVAQWEQEHGVDKASDHDTFARDILPRLEGVSLRDIANATGLSEGYCSFIRNGRKTPHRRHWKVLARLGGDQ
jgi:CRISPR-associated endonuclease Cas1